MAMMSRSQKTAGTPGKGAVMTAKNHAIKDANNGQA
jgi:hypothetical protein